MPNMVTRANLGAWVLKCNPEVWDLAAFLALGGTTITDWSVAENYRSDLMRKGDPVIFWVSGPRSGEVTYRGLWGVGRLAGLPQMNPAGDQPVEDSLWLDTRMEATHDYGVLTDLPLLDEPIPAEVIEHDPILGGCEILRAQQMANPSYLTKEEYAGLKRVLRTHQPPDTEQTVTFDRLGGAGFGDRANNKKVEDAAMQAVRRHLEKRGYKVFDVSRRNVGWDLTAYRSRDQHLRYVEVKGVSGTQEKVLLTANEINRADDNKEWELAIVTSALSDPKIHFYGVTALDERMYVLVWQADLTTATPRKEEA